MGRQVLEREPIDVEVDEPEGGENIRALVSFSNGGRYWGVNYQVQARNTIQCIGSWDDTPAEDGEALGFADSFLV